MRVLIIDDDAAYLSACRLVLAQDGHNMITASSFTDGRRCLEEYNFDALIADVRLGAYNGLHLITLAAPSTVKIAMSAFADIVIRRDAEAAGARFVVKPSDSASLAALLPAAGVASEGNDGGSA
jgi:DNA-binding response OmpR family regulator